MNEKAKEKFLEIKKLFNRMSNEMCIVVESYYIWRALTFARSIPEVGQEKADKNAYIMSEHKDFFIPTEQSHMQTFVVGLMKFFDQNSQSLSIKTLIKEIETNKDAFTPDVLRAVYPDLDKIGAIDDDYIPIDQDIVDQLEKLQEKYETLISSFKELRNKRFAHADMRAIKGTFVPLEVEAFIDDIQEMFNKLSSRFDLSSTVFDHLKEDSLRSTEFILEELIESEARRQGESKNE